LSGPDVDHQVLLERAISASELKLLVGAQAIPTTEESAETQETEVSITQAATPEFHNLDQLALF